MPTTYIPALIYHQVLTDGMPIRERKPGEGIVSGQIYLQDFIRPWYTVRSCHGSDVTSV